MDYMSQDYYDNYMIDWNYRLVKSEKLLLAVYNGVWRNGTGVTVNNARKLGLEIIVISPLTRPIIHKGSEKRGGFHQFA